MAIMITDDCINCGACEPECPNNAIYEGGVEWTISDGTTISAPYKIETGETVGRTKIRSRSAMNFIISFPINARSAWAFTRSRSAPPFAR